MAVGSWCNEVCSEELLQQVIFTLGHIISMKSSSRGSSEGGQRREWISRMTLVGDLEADTASHLQFGQQLVFAIMELRMELQLGRIRPPHQATVAASPW